ncbi:hypothetical protein AB6A40_001730 [Gnathostoma spinigerum]|uniref:DNA repair protein RAD51 homolog 3 n=1 Tax=Gnathostoma spinigerum TaxID=75299 RepID=A0ABD6E642_9BILA
MTNNDEDEVVFETADALLVRERTEEKISTGYAKFDELLGGGIRYGTTLEVVGPSATGKSQLCMQLAVNVQKNERRRSCVYIDTEGSFHTRRICQLAEYHLPSMSAGSVLGAINHCRCHDLVELTSAVHRLRDLLRQSHDIALVILDSIAMPIRAESESVRRNSSVINIAVCLGRLSAQFRCSLIVVNQVTTSFKRGFASRFGSVSSALGSSWSHRPTMRLWLSRPDEGSHHRTAYLEKSPLNEDSIANYVISDRGIEATNELLKLTAPRARRTDMLS